MLRRLFYILLLFITSNIYATHNRAGEITFKHLTGLTYEITVTTYTDVSSSTNADRPELEIRWGDNSPLDSIARTNQVLLGNGIKKNIYVDRHTYPGANPTPYTISVEDPNRNGGSMNIPNSLFVVFYIETELLINPFVGVNNSPDLLNPPIDNACVGSIYVHNPGAVDFDGDSLYYTISESFGIGGQPIAGYQFPTASNFITINNFTGDLIWDSPINQGEYNVAILIEEFRDGIRIGSILRDLQITVVPTCPPPPVITGITDTCVIAGDTLDFNINATGSSAVTLSATGIPFSITNPASFQQTTNPSTITSGNFYWETQCNHVRNNSYFVSFKALDAGNLADFHTTIITVIGPPPENLIPSVQSNEINLTWDKTICDQAVRYKIYRRQGASGWFPQRCETGVSPSAGFELIATTNTINDTTYSDDNNGVGLVHGIDYCYRIVACYPDGAESKASDEICAQLKKDVPIITNVDVNTTSTTTGSIYVAWSKPTEHDTTQFPSPYRYLIYRGLNTNNLVLIDSTASIDDTTYVDTLINTQDVQYYYRVDIYSVPVGFRDLIGRSTVASSVFLTLTPSDKQITLTWNENVPWTNTQYTIYRLNNITSIYDSIGVTSNSNYIDTGLINLTNYCYKIKSTGTYSSSGLIDPIINFSEEVCTEPIDNIAPCPPNLCVEVDCEQQQNILSWTNQTTGCADDVVQYNIYKKDSLSGEYVLITSINNSVDSTFIHNNISTIVGCYVITAIDSAQNESINSDSVCIDNPNRACKGNKGCVSSKENSFGTNCLEYRLPNVFSPGQDNINDLFIPFPYQFIESINITIFNRWGKLMFETTDPEILWDGTNMATGTPCSDGTYYYVCTVNENCLTGITPRILKGFITLIRNKGNNRP